MKKNFFWSKRPSNEKRRRKCHLDHLPLSYLFTVYKNKNKKSFNKVFLLQTVVVDLVYTCIQKMIFKKVSKATIENLRHENEKEKMLILILFSLSNNVFQRYMYRARQ